MVGIGINEYVSVSNDTKVNEKGTLELVLKQGNISEAEKIRMSLEGNDVDEKATKLLVFGPNSVTDYQSNKKAPAQVLKEIQNFRKSLYDILSVFVSSDVLDVDFGTKLPLEVSGVEAIAFENQLKSDDSISKLSQKIAETFVDLCSKYNVFTSKETFRIKLWRQSVAKNFPKLPTGFDKWIEPMNVPVITVVPSKYDLTDFDAAKNPGINRLSHQPVAADVVPTIVEEAANNLFGAMETKELPF